MKLARMGLREPALAVIAALCLAGMVVVPFLHYWHFFPIPSFFAEWWAAVFGVAAALIMVLFITRLPTVTLPVTVLIPGLLVVVLLIQFALGRIEFVQIGLLGTLYLIWAALLGTIGRTMAKCYGLDFLARILAPAFVIGGLAAAAIGLSQWAGGWLAGSGLMFPKIGGVSSYGNLGQPNHQADYLWLGVASSIYLYGKGQVGRLACVGAIGVLVLASVVSGSRSVVLYSVAATILAGWMWRGGGGGSYRRVLDASLLALVAIPVAQWLVSVSGFPDARLSTFFRLYESISTVDMRRALYGIAWIAAWKAPWLGNGVGEFPWQSFNIAPLIPEFSERVVAEHAHNVFLQLAVEFGWLATAGVIYFVGRWLIQFLRQNHSLEWWWAACLLAIIGIHSQFEYPLWYAYFLGPFALLMGATDKCLYAVAPKSMRLYMGLMVAMGLVVLGTLRTDYGRLESSLNWPLRGATDHEVAWRGSLDSLLVLQRDSLLSPWATDSFAALVDPASDHVKERSFLCQRGMRITPASTIATKCAVMLLLEGHQKEAEVLLGHVLAAFPRETSTIRADLDRYGRAFPELVPLQQLANR